MPSHVTERVPGCGPAVIVQASTERVGSVVEICSGGGNPSSRTTPCTCRTCSRNHRSNGSSGDGLERGAEVVHPRTADVPLPSSGGRQTGGVPANRAPLRPSQPPPVGSDRPRLATSANGTTIGSGQHHGRGVVLDETLVAEMIARLGGALAHCCGSHLCPAAALRSHRPLGKALACDRPARVLREPEARRLVVMVQEDRVVWPRVGPDRTNRLERLSNAEGSSWGWGAMTSVIRGDHQHGGTRLSVQRSAVIRRSEVPCSGR